MSNEKTKHFEDLHMKVKLEVQPTIKEAEKNPMYQRITYDINELCRSKINEKCGNIYERLLNISSGNKIRLDENNNIEMSAVKGKEKEFLKLKIDLEQCSSVDHIGQTHLMRINKISTFKLKVNDFCLDKCREKFNNDNETTACIKDCYTLMLLNVKATIPIVNDELMKYLSSVKKL
jgi:hypothetical protein